jgi:rubredoxin
MDECTRCGGEVIWQDCPTGGWWYHLDHPADNHDAAAHSPFEYMNDQGEWVTPRHVIGIQEG